MTGHASAAEPDPMRPALFLDRDGVIIENRSDYVRDWSEVQLLPGVLDELARLRPLPLAIVVVTNQSAIGRGLLSADRADEINRRLVAEITAAGGRIDRVYVCPHSPEDSCSCRKPRPGLLLQAADELGIVLGESILVGDAESDIQAGRAAGLKRTVLVRTGRGLEHEPILSASGHGAVSVFDDLPQALRALFP